MVESKVCPNKVYAPVRIKQIKPGQWKWKGLCWAHYKEGVEKWDFKPSGVFVGRFPTFCGEVVVENPPLREAVPTKYRPDDPMYTFVVMTGELGSLCKQYIRSQHYYISDRKMSAAYMAECRQALADLITQCRLLVEELSLDWDGLIRDGEEAFRERMKDIVKWQEGK